MKRAALALGWLLAGTAGAATVPGMDSGRGDSVYESQGCVDCHRSRGRGGTTGPDLGRTIGRAKNPEDLAATMWNHAPVMWATIRSRGGAPPELSPQAAADLFASLYSARYFETPGDAARGKRLFDEKNCAHCHGLISSPNAGALPVKQWRSLTDPVAMVGAMWQHSPQMRSELARQKKSWPELSGQDLSDLEVYLRSQASSGNTQATFRIAAPAAGEKLFEAKGCAACHNDKARALTRTTLTAVAAAMWNHAGILRYEAPQVDENEMRGLVSYAWARPYFAETGSAQHGKQVFTGKKCVACHSSGGTGPDLKARAGEFSGISMVSSLWRHGPAMLSQMTSQNIAWPTFRPGEMADLMAFLNAGGPKK